MDTATRTATNAAAYVQNSRAEASTAPTKSKPKSKRAALHANRVQRALFTLRPSRSPQHHSRTQAASELRQQEPIIHNAPRQCEGQHYHPTRDLVEPLRSAARRAAPPKKHRFSPVQTTASDVNQSPILTVAGSERPSIMRWSTTQRPPPPRPRLPPMPAPPPTAAVTGFSQA